jgi:hypothetical protein
MDKEVFLDLVWRLEEILMEADHLEKRVGNCGEQCGIENEGLCPECCKALEKVIAEDKRLVENKELDNILNKLKRACDEDMTGEYERILKQSREGKVFH